MLEWPKSFYEGGIMESKRGIFWYKVMALVLVLALIVPVLAACGDDDEEETTTPAATTLVPCNTYNIG